MWYFRLTMNSRKLWWPLAVNDQNQQEMFFRWVGKRWLLTGESARTRKTERWWTNWPADCFASGTGIRTCGLWKAHQVNVIWHQRILQLTKDGHKSIFLQFYRCYLNISIAQFTLGWAFHKGKPAILGWKNIWMKMSKHIPIANCWSSDLPPDGISTTIPWKKLI